MRNGRTAYDHVVEQRERSETQALASTNAKCQTDNGQPEAGRSRYSPGTKEGSAVGPDRQKERQDIRRRRRRDDDDESMRPFKPSPLTYVLTANLCAAERSGLSLLRSGEEWKLSADADEKFEAVRCCLGGGRTLRAGIGGHATTTRL